MSELVQMRQRIKAIETIKKITHAMRLISMSTHSRLRSKKEFIELYKKETADLFLKVSKIFPALHNEILFPDQHLPENQLVILIGSQKGLCGNFNGAVFLFFEKYFAHLKNKQINLIVVGKKAHDYAKMYNKSSILSFDNVSYSTISTIAEQIAHHISTAKNPYTSVHVFSNHPKTFFIQQPKDSTVIPFDGYLTADTGHSIDYSFEQPAQDILNFLSAQTLFISLQDLLLQSLIAEQAARFIAMDNSTRNAGNLLDRMRLNYNKMRQTKITRELTDLIGGF